MKKKYEMKDKDFFANDTLEVLYQMLKLKNLFRQGWLKRDVPERVGESVADHTFGVVITAWIIAKELKLEIDMEKLLKMSIIHEAGEVYAGDITPVDGISLEEKYELELAGVNKIFADYSNGAEFIELWKEFELAESPEAKFLKQIDKFEMGLQASIYKKHDYGVIEEFLHSADRAVKDDKLRELFKEIFSKE